MIATDREELAAIADAIPQIVWVADPSGDIFFYNAMYYAATGFPQGTPVGRVEWARVVEPEDLATVLASREAAFAAGSPYDEQLRIRRLGAQTYRWFRYRERPSRRPDGTIAAWFGAMTDVDDQVRAIEETQRRATRFREIAETIAPLVWTASRDGAIEYVGDMLRARLAERGILDPAAQPWVELAHPDDRASVTATLAAARERHEARDFDARLGVGRDGEYRWYALQLRPFAIDGEDDRWIGTAVDVDDRIRAALRSEAIIRSLVEVLVPRPLPATPPFALDACYVPAAEEARVGGDFYDAVMMPDGRLVFALGDVAGHGVEAAVVMTRARDAIFARAIDERDPVAVLACANKVLRLYDETMVTAIVGCLDASRATVRYAAAGHPPPIVVSRDRTSRVLPVGGTPLGVFDELAVSTHEAPFGPGEMLVLYTDGITEYGRDVEDGERRLAAAAAAAIDSPAPARAIVSALLGSGRAPDDVAVLTITHAGP